MAYVNLMDLTTKHIEVAIVTKINLPNTAKSIHEIGSSEYIC